MHSNTIIARLDSKKSSEDLFSILLLKFRLSLRALRNIPPVSSMYTYICSFATLCIFCIKLILRRVLRDRSDSLKKGGAYVGA